MRNATAFILIAIVVLLCAGHASADIAFGPRTLVLENAWTPSLSDDGKSLYFAAAWPGGQGGFDVYVTTRQDSGDPWGEPVNLGATVNSEFDEGGPTISANGRELFFTDAPLVAGSRPGGFGGGDLWVSTRTEPGLPWGEPVNLGATVNSEQFDWGSSISDDGKWLYFDSLRPGYLGQEENHPFDHPFDLWVTHRETLDGAWGEPVHLGATVNSVGADEAPCISAEGLHLLFHAHRPDSPEGDLGDVWMSTRASIDDDWGEPMRLPAPVNTLGWEAYPTVSSDFPQLGSSLYFMWSTTGDLFGPWNIYEVKVVPEPSTLLMATVAIASLVYTQRRRRLRI